MQFTTTTGIKQSNKIKILRYVRCQEETTQPEIAKALKISRPTVSTLVEELVNDGYIQIRGIGTSTFHGGKRPKLLAFHHGGKGIITIHINYEIIDGALLDLKANVLFRIKMKVKHKEKNNILTEIYNIISELLGKADELNIPVQGIGVGCPGLVDTHSGTILHSVNFEEINNLELGKFISDKFQITVLIDNEDHNLALAEHCFGVGTGSKSFVSLVTDVGIGAGILIGNKIYRGIDNSFGEIGHTTINFEGPRCHCGNNGCWETYASSNALLRQIKEKFECTEILKKLLHSPDELTVSHIVEAVEQGDQVVEKIAVYNLGRYLGLGIVNIVNTFNPEMVIIHGTVTDLGEKLRIRIESYVKEKALPIPGSRVKIKFSDLGNNAHIIGAGALILMEMFDRPELLFHSKQ
jgi:N-acetylglucosamine repressor